MGAVLPFGTHGACFGFRGVWFGFHGAWFGLRGTWFGFHGAIFGLRCYTSLKKLPTFIRLR